MERRTRAFKAVEQATALPMLVLSILLIPLLLVPLFFSIPEYLRGIWLAVEWLIWAAFAVELAIKTYLAPRRGRYLRDHWFDVVLVLLPLLRPLRLVRSVRLLALLRSARLFSAVVKVVGTARFVLRRRGLQYVLLVSGAVVVAAATAMTFVERDAGGSITDFGTALWWAMTTVTTVGYGDTFPVTPEGRGIGAFVMLIGITLFGLLTANIAAFFVETEHRAGDEPTLQDVMAQLRSLEQQLSELREEMRQATA